MGGAAAVRAGTPTLATLWRPGGVLRDLNGLCTIPGTAAVRHARSARTRKTLCSAGGSARHSCGGPLLLTRWRAVARCADGSSALQALLLVGRDRPGHSHAIYEASVRAEYFLLRRRVHNCGCARLAVKQWPGIGVTMECARDAPLPRPSAVLPYACDFTRSCFLGSFVLLTSPRTFASV